jgi:hypothetical protein
MKLLTKENLKKLPALYETENIPLEEKIAVVKFFTPDAQWTWYAVEYNPKQELFWGLVDGQEKEWGYFTLGQLKSVRGKLGLSIERDLYFSPQPIKKYL